MLIIANTLIQQPKRWLYTWTSPNGQYRNQIDYVLCSPSWRNSIQSVKTRLEADCGSDHELLIAKFRLKLKKVGKTTWRRQWHPTPVFLPGKSHGQRSLVGYSPWGRKESDMTERPHFPFLSMGMVLIPVSCTMSRTSVHSSSGTLSDLIPWNF